MLPYEMFCLIIAQRMKGLLQNPFGCLLQVFVIKTSCNIMGILTTQEVTSFSLREYRTAHINFFLPHFITYTSKEFYFPNNTHYFQRYISKRKQSFISLKPKNFHKFHLQEWKWNILERQLAEMWGTSFIITLQQFSCAST